MKERKKEAKKERKMQIDEEAGVRLGQRPNEL